MASTNSKAAMLLMRQLNDLKKNTDCGFSAGLVDEANPFEWQVILTGPPDTWYDGGLFKAKLSFPPDYPYMPPTMRFTSEMWHPNIYKDGKVCISILHNPGSDPNMYENASERWNPVHTVESILVSVISMLSCPNDESAANLDAAKEWRETPDVFKKKGIRHSVLLLLVRDLRAGRVYLSRCHDPRKRAVRTTHQLRSVLFASTKGLWPTSLNVRHSRTRPITNSVATRETTRWSSMTAFDPVSPEASSQGSPCHASAAYTERNCRPSACDLERNPRKSNVRRALPPGD